MTTIATSTMTAPTQPVLVAGIRLIKIPRHHGYSEAQETHPQLLTRLLARGKR